MKLRLMHDWVHARVDPAPTQSAGGILLVGPQPLRNATVLGVGPGRRDSKDRLIPTQLQVGDRFPFFKAASETRQGHALAMMLEDDEVLIRESDVLFVDEQGVQVSL
jgi:co-chaperonin GroES (HSP10)